MVEVSEFMLKQTDTQTCGAAEVAKNTVQILYNCIFLND